MRQNTHQRRVAAWVVCLCATLMVIPVFPADVTAHAGAPARPAVAVELGGAALVEIEPAQVPVASAPAQERRSLPATGLTVQALLFLGFVVVALGAALVTGRRPTS